MPTETLRPEGELSDTGLVANTFTDHDHDPDSDTTTVDATANNVNTEWGGDFATPTGNPTTGANKQEFRVGVIRFETGQAGTPNARIELWENGSLVRAGSNTGVSGTHSVLSFLWDASELATADGSLVQCKLIGTKVGGASGTRATVGIGGMEWNVEYSAAETTLKSISFSTVTGMGTSTAIVFAKPISVGFTTSMTATMAITFAKAIGVAFQTAMSLKKTIGKKISVGFTTGFAVVKKTSAIKAVSFVTAMASTSSITFAKAISVGFVSAMATATSLIMDAGPPLRRLKKMLRLRLGTGL